MNAAQLAKKWGISKPRMSRMIADGIISKSVKRLENGRYEINVKLAEKEIKGNLDATYKIKSKPARNTKTKKVKSKVKKKANTVQRKSKAKPRTKTGSRAGNKRGIVYQTERARNEQLKADINEIKKKQMLGQLVDVNAVKEAWTKHIGAAKVKLLGIRPELTPMIRETIEDQDISEAILQAIDSKIEGVLIELSNSKI